MEFFLPLLILCWNVCFHVHIYGFLRYGEITGQNANSAQFLQASDISLKNDFYVLKFELLRQIHFHEV